MCRNYQEKKDHHQQGHELDYARWERRWTTVPGDPLWRRIYIPIKTHTWFALRVLFEVLRRRFMR